MKVCEHESWKEKRYVGIAEEVRLAEKGEAQLRSSASRTGTEQQWGDFSERGKRFISGRPLVHSVAILGEKSLKVPVVMTLR